MTSGACLFHTPSVVRDSPGHHALWISAISVRLIIILFFDNFSAKRRMAFFLMWWPASAAVRSAFVVHHKVSGGSHSSRTAWSRITKFYTDIRTESFYSHTRGCDITSYFRSEAIAKKTVENAASNGVISNFSITVFTKITKLYSYIGHNQPHKAAGYDLTGFFQSTAKYNTILHKSA